MDKSYKDQSIALAGIFQSAALVHQLAVSGTCSTEEFEICIRSIFNQNPTSAADVYDNKIDKLNLGAKELLKLIGERRNSHDNHIVNYALSLIHLENKLRKNSKMLDSISEKLDSTAHQLEHFPPTHSNVIANLASVYQETISTYRFRIQIKGNSRYLQVPEYTNKIRALLLAGIRAAILWRQVGGSRWTLFFKSKKVRSALEELAYLSKESV